MKWIVFWLISLGGWIGATVFLGKIAFFVSFAIFIFFTIPLVYSVLAPKNLFFTFIKEGTCKIVMRGEQFERALIQWKGYTIDDNGNVDEREETPGFFKQMFGGLRFYGIPLFQKLYKYRQRWTHLHEDGTAKAHDEELDSVFLKEDLYVFEFVSTDAEAIEDINGVPLAVTVVMPMRIVNPYEALFVARRWLAMVSGIVKAATRRFIAGYRYKEDLLNMRAGKGIGDVQEEAGLVTKVKEAKDLQKEFWKELKKAVIEGGDEREVEEVGEDICLYGILIKKRGTGILKIDPSPQYRELTTKEYEAEQKAKRQAREWFGMVLYSFAFFTGKSVKELQGEIEKSEELKREFLDYAKDINIRLEGAERNAYLDIRVQGVEGVEQSILNLIAAFKRMPSGCSSQGGEEAGKEEAGKEEGRKKTTSERIQKGKELISKYKKKYPQ